MRAGTAGPLPGLRGGAGALCSRSALGTTDHGPRGGPGAEADVASAPRVSPPLGPSPSRLWGPRFLGRPWFRGLPCAPAESRCVGGGPDGRATRGPHTLLSPRGCWRLAVAPAEDLGNAGRAPGQLSIGHGSAPVLGTGLTGYQRGHQAHFRAKLGLGMRPLEDRPWDWAFPLGGGTPSDWLAGVGTPCDSHFPAEWVPGFMFSPCGCPARRARWGRGAASRALSVQQGHGGPSWAAVGSWRHAGDTRAQSAG